MLSYVLSPGARVPHADSQRSTSRSGSFRAHAGCVLLRLENLIVGNVMAFQSLLKRLPDCRQAFLGIVGGLTLLFAGVGVANIMYVVVRERTREIGIKMAMGAKRRHILNQFLLEALLVCFTGGALGILISALACEFLRLIPVDAGNDAMNWLGRPTISTTIGLIVAGILVTIGVFSGLFPARKAAATNPVESLRYE